MESCLSFPCVGMGARAVGKYPNERAMLKEQCSTPTGKQDLSQIFGPIKHQLQNKDILKGYFPWGSLD